MSPSNAQDYASKWTEFTRLSTTQDTLARERGRLRRWLLLPYVAFVIPIDDPAVRARLLTWQQALAPWLNYTMAPDQLHITLHHAGTLRHSLLKGLPYTWRRGALPALARRAQPTLQDFNRFTVRLGPLNSFPNALFAEVHDDRECLRAMRLKLRRSLPVQARPPSAWSYLPHVTLGFWGKQPAAPLVDLMETFRTVDPIECEVRRVKFTIYERDTLPSSTDLLSAARETVIAEFTLQERPD
ncbi:MAG TPA: 2'-5' RNA ligase family protein [Aggregatilinea sp.]|uniref:2'-5' RNA ligase family protein n=1 Tax=Aggregatilinea sp. TaxID=2806333 RepID=UPI002C54C774|nr:2'-5' RNA ligase family protein [Aggregatilinea sp.]HML21267.1 2'-5' RNA ligase family protein [Aggregatilinea sp.]